MKTILTIAALACLLSSKLVAQNSEYRVEKITETRVRDKTYVTENIFNYIDDKLNAITVIDDGKQSDLRTFSYKKENISVNSTRLKGESNSLTIKDNVVETYKSNKANTFTFIRINGNITTLNHQDKCNEIYYGYLFEYGTNGKPSNVTLVNKLFGDKAMSNYTFTYSDGKLTQMNEMTNSGKLKVRAYTLEYAGSNVSKVTIMFYDKFERRIEFDYDEAGNIIAQREFIDGAPGASPITSLAITYAKAKGNDNILWSVYNWKYNLLLGCRTYFELEIPCY